MKKRIGLLILFTVLGNGAWAQSTFQKEFTELNAQRQRDQIKAKEAIRESNEQKIFTALAQAAGGSEPADIQIESENIASRLVGGLGAKWGQEDLGKQIDYVLKAKGTACRAHVDIFEKSKNTVNIVVSCIQNKRFLFERKSTVVKLDEISE